MSLFFIPVLVGSFISFLLHRRHLLLSLLSLEGIMISLIISISVSSSFIVCNFSLIIIFVLAVIEASVGLSALVSISRFSDSSMVSA